MATLPPGGTRGPRHGTTQAAVADQLRDEILSGRLPPGTPLRQNEVAERYQTSTTPVREALQQLVAEGLLDGDPHRGVSVHRTASEELEQIYEIRMVLEPLSITATVANITERELAQAEELVDALDGETDAAVATELNNAFHMILTEAARRPRLAGILRRLRNLSALYIAHSLADHPERMQAANQEHRELLEACRANDAERAREVERSHLGHTLELGKTRLGTADTTS